MKTGKAIPINKPDAPVAPLSESPSNCGMIATNGTESIGISHKVSRSVHGLTNSADNKPPSPIPAMKHDWIKPTSDFENSFAANQYESATGTPDAATTRKVPDRTSNKTIT